jgi:hypothetical protein
MLDIIQSDEFWLVEVPLNQLSKMNIILLSVTSLISV